MITKINHKIVQEKGYKVVHVEERYLHTYQYWEHIKDNKYRLIAKDDIGGEPLGTIETFHYPNIQKIHMDGD